MIVVTIIIIVNDVTFIISSIIIVIIVIINVSIIVIVIVTVVIVIVVSIIVSVIVSIIIIIANIIVVIIIILSKIVNIMVGIIVIIIIIMIIIHATGVSRLRVASSHHGASWSRHCPACQRSLFLYLSRNQIKTTGLTELIIKVKFSLSCSLIASKQKKKGTLASPDNTDGQAVPIY